MRQTGSAIPTALVLLLALLSGGAIAANDGGQSVRQAGFEVHYAAINSTEIQPAPRARSARAY